MEDNVIDFNKALAKSRLEKSPLTLRSKLINNEKHIEISKKIGDIPIFNNPNFTNQNNVSEIIYPKKNLFTNTYFEIVISSIIAIQILLYFLPEEDLKHKSIKQLYATVKYKDSIKLSQSMEEVHKKKIKDFTENIFSVNNINYANVVEEIQYPGEVKDNLQKNLASIFMSKEFISQLNTEAGISVKTKVDIEKIKIINMNKNNSVIEVPFTELWSSNKKVMGTYYYELTNNKLTNFKKEI